MTARTFKKAIKVKAKEYQDRNVHEVLKIKIADTLKVSKSQKEIVVFSISSKKTNVFFLISTLRVKSKNYGKQHLNFFLIFSDLQPFWPLRHFIFNTGSHPCVLYTVDEQRRRLCEFMGMSFHIHGLQVRQFPSFSPLDFSRWGDRAVGVQGGASITPDFGRYGSKPFPSNCLKTKYILGIYQVI